MNVYLDSNTLEYYKSKSKLYQYLYNCLSTAYFRATSDCLTMYLKGSLGLFKIDLPCQSESDEVKYFSLDFSKWTNALAKFDGCNGITLSINRNLVKLSVEESSDVINLSISAYGDDNLEVTSLDTLLLQKSVAILGANLSVDITDEIADDLALVNSLFIPQQDVNSIGLGPTGIIYAVRSVILKALFTQEIPDSLFANCSDDYVYLHKYTIGFINHVYGTNPTINFSSDYSTVYWSDDSSSIFLTQPSRELDIPSDEDLESFAPDVNNPGRFSVDVNTLRDSLGFFDGFYAGSVWKPIKFESIANKEVLMRYEHPTADVTKALPAVAPEDGTFVLDSDTVKKVLMKVRDKRLDKTSSLEASFSFDEDSPGVLCEIGDYYNIIFCKLNDED